MSDVKLSPDSRRKLQRALTSCGACRLRLDALDEAGLDVTERRERLEKTEAAAKRLLQLDDAQPGSQ